MNEKPSLAIIGGSGLYSIPGLEDISEIHIETPFGAPSSKIMLGSMEGLRLAFLSRHGIGHHILPGEVNYRANIYALKLLGIKWIVSISACGSLREDYAPEEIVIPDQLFDFTRGRKRTFFGDGVVAHINVADPFCPQLSEITYKAVQETGAITHKNGTFITIEGPRFSTKAESNVFRSWGMSLIGMTASPEAFLAREAEMCYAVMAHVTDFDVWHISEEPVTVDMVIEILNRNTKVAQQAIRNLARGLPVEENCGCRNALANALITERTKIPLDTRNKLSLLVNKYLE
jgi:5'-methylthioadenosine phosphorylase